MKNISCNYIKFYTHSGYLMDFEIGTPVDIISWLAVLKNDVKFIVSASTKAEKATKFILNICDVEGTE